MQCVDSFAVRRRSAYLRAAPQVSVPLVSGINSSPLKKNNNPGTKVSAFVQGSFRSLNCFTLHVFAIGFKNMIQYGTLTALSSQLLRARLSVTIIRHVRKNKWGAICLYIYLCYIYSFIFYIYILIVIDLGPFCFIPFLVKGAGRR